MATLEQQLQTLQKVLCDTVPPPKLAIMQQATQALRQKGLLDKAIQTGETAPSVVLTTSENERISLQSLLKNGPVVMTFFRGYWCEFCQITLQAYQERFQRMQDNGIQLIAVSPQQQEHSSELASRFDLQFPIYYDPNNQAARQFGIVFCLPEALQNLYRDWEVELPLLHGYDAWELPIPATFAIDAQNRIRYAHLDVDYRNRLDPDECIDMLM